MVGSLPPLWTQFTLLAACMVARIVGYGSDGSYGDDTSSKEGTDGDCPPPVQCTGELAWECASVPCVKSAT
jgi:hypothetical protein